MRRGRLYLVRPMWVLVVGLLLVASGCTPLATPAIPTSTPTPVRPLKPTFTPTPTRSVATAATPTTTQAVTLSQATPTPSPTPTPQATPSPTPTPTPYVEVNRPRVNVRSGPGIVYPVVTQLSQGAQAPIVGRNAAGDWWQICCVNGQEAWIAASVVEAKNDTTNVPVAQNIPTPPPTPTPRPTPRPTPTPKPTPTPAYLFERTFGPHPILNTNPVMTVWVLVAERDGKTPVAGVQVRLYFGGNVLAEGTSSGAVGYTRPGPEYGFYFPYNVKLEIPNPPSGAFELVVLQGGREVSPRVPFNRGGESPGAEFYFRFERR